MKTKTLRCPYDNMQTLLIQCSVENGKNIIEEKSSARAIHMLKMGLIVLQPTEFKFEIVDTEKLFQDRILPDFGFSPGQYIWISSQCRQNYGAERVLKGLRERVVFEITLKMSLRALRQHTFHTVEDTVK
jgi:hypothetical protein